MGSPFHSVNVAVQTAVRAEDHEKLSKLGRKGAEVKKRKRERMISRMLTGAQEKLAQGNEDWCPPAD